MANSTYTVGWICAIDKEYVAATALLDNEHEDAEYHLAPNDTNAYTLGEIGKHNVVIAVLPDGEYGTSAASSVAKDMLNTFPNVRIGLMVGIGGGVPSENNDIRLGDVVVSSASNGESGVIQYDFGKMIQDQAFHITGHLDKPPTVLRTAVSKLRGRHQRKGHNIGHNIDIALEANKIMKKKYSRPDPSTDKLYMANFVHRVGACCTTDSPSQEPNLVSRKGRDEEDSTVIHYGLIASGNRLMKDAQVRDKFGKENNVLCFEMEAAGLMNRFPCLVIRGICDYADSHKDKLWQGYAAMAAAAYAKELLYQITPSHIVDGEKIVEIVHRNEEKLDNIMKRQRTLEDREILDWLTKVDYGIRHNDIFRTHQSATGQWLLDSDKYKSWINQRQKTLFCPGIPGAGKTVLASVVVQHLREQALEDTNMGVAFIYCEYQNNSTQDIVTFLSCLIKQLCENLPDLPERLRSLYQRDGRLQTRPSTQELSGLLRVVLSTYSKTYLVIDALDECEKTQRGALLREVFNLQTSTGVNILATSRFIPDIEKTFEQCMVLEIQAAKADICQYAISRSADLPDFVLEDPELQNKITQEIAEATRGMFLLAKLYMDSLKDATNLNDVYSCIRVPSIDAAYKNNILPYDDAYDKAVIRIKGQLPNLAKLAIRVLLWVTFAETPLTETELRHAVSVKVGASYFDEQYLVRINFVSLCAGLVTIDETSRHIRLVHYTAQDYFQRKMDSLFPDAQSEIVNVCTTYLSFLDSYTGFAPCLWEALTWYPLWEYAVLHWGFHALRVSNISSIRDSVLNVMKSENLLRLSAQMIQPYFSRIPIMYQGTLDIRALHLAAYFGLVEIASLLCKDSDANITNSNRETPLLWAAQFGHEGVVRTLVNHGAHVEGSDEHRMTPLTVAAENGHTAVVHVLLESGAFIEGKSPSTDSPLLCATQNDRQDVVRFLIENGALVCATKSTEINILDFLNHDYEPFTVEKYDTFHKKSTLRLCVAAELDDAALVGFLLQTNGQMDDSDPQGVTPLSWASQFGREKTVEFLLENGALVNKADKCGLTPLSRASMCNHGSTVRILVEYGALLEVRDNDGRTPLFWASTRRPGSAMKVLIRKGASIETCDNKGRTPLLFAVEMGHLRGAEFLLSQGASPNVRDNRGETCLTLARRKTCKPEMEQLLLQSGAR